MEEIPHHLEGIKPCKSRDKLPTSTGERRISEASTISLVEFLLHFVACEWRIDSSVIGVRFAKFFRQAQKCPLNDMLQKVYDSASGQCYHEGEVTGVCQVSAASARADKFGKAV